MSEKDKKLIKDIQQLLNNTNYCDNLGKGQVLGLIKLIKKLQKENEKLKEKVKFYKEGFNTAYKEFEELRAEVENENSISKDIIKKLIEDKKQIGTYNIEYLKIEDINELLGE